MQQHPVIAIAETPRQREEIYRFRYRIYVEEMGRYQDVADHEGKRLIEADDSVSHLVGAWVDDRLVGTARLRWGGDEPFTGRHIQQYNLEKFRETVPDEQMIIGERFMIDAEFRGSSLLYRLFCFYMTFVNERRIQLVFGDCEPHLLNVYQGLGFRPYTHQNVNSPQTGYLIPLVMVAEDIGYFESISSPLVAVLKDFGAEHRVPGNIEELLHDPRAVTSQRLVDMQSYWESIAASLKRFEDTRKHLFAGLTDEEIQNCLGRSNIIRCEKGDRVIKKGNVAQNMYLVLNGVVEVREGDQVLAAICAGETFGEIAFFLQLPRTRDVYAAGDDVEILSFSDGNLRALIESESGIAAKLLRNISIILCERLAKAN